MSEFKNVKIKASVGKFYESSTTEKNGWKKVDTKEHGVRYHREFKNLKGKLLSLRVDDGGNYGERLKIFVEDSEQDDVINVLEIPTFNSNRSLNDYVRCIAKYIDAIKVGEDVEIFLNSKHKDKKGYLYKTIFMKQDGDIIINTLTKEEIPAWEQKTDPFKKGKTIWDSTNQDAFLYNRIVEYTKKDEEEATINEDKSRIPSNDEKLYKAVSSQDEEDDLPF